MRRALIIEDDPESGRMVMRALGRERITCVLTSTFADGLAANSENGFDCIILDAGLPDEDLAGEFATIEIQQRTQQTILFRLRFWNQTNNVFSEPAILQFSTPANLPEAFN